MELVSRNGLAVANSFLPFALPCLKPEFPVNIGLRQGRAKGTSLPQTDVNWKLLR